MIMYFYIFSLFCIVQGIDLDFRSMRYIKIDIIIINCLSSRMKRM